MMCITVIWKSRGSLARFLILEPKHQESHRKQRKQKIQNQPTLLSWEVKGATNQKAQEKTIDHGKVSRHLPIRYSQLQYTPLEIFHIEPENCGFH